jgi:hypothetical protein
MSNAQWRTGVADGNHQVEGSKLWRFDGLSAHAFLGTPLQRAQCASGAGAGRRPARYAG